MNGKFKYNAFPGASSLSSQAHHEGKIKPTDDEIFMQNEAEKLILEGVEKRIYQEYPYLGQNGQARIRIKDDSKKVLYDNTLERYLDLNRSLGFVIPLEEIERLIKYAKENPENNKA